MDRPTYNRPHIFVVDQDAAFWSRRTKRLAAEAGPVRPFATAEDFLRDHNLLERALPEAAAGEVSGVEPFPAPGCLVTETNLAGMSGLDLQQHVNEWRLNLPIVFLAAHPTIPQVVAALRAGALDFLEKAAADTSALVSAVRQALAADVRFRTAFARRAALRARLDALPPRQRQVLALLQDGCELKEIARRLGTSYHTVRNQRVALLRSLDVESVAQLREMLRAAEIVAITSFSAQPQAPASTSSNDLRRTPAPGR